MANLAWVEAVKATRRVEDEVTLQVEVAPDLTVEEFTNIVIKCSAVLYDAGVQPMEIMLAFQQAAAAQGEPSPPEAA